MKNVSFIFTSKLKAILANPIYEVTRIGKYTETKESRLVLARAAGERNTEQMLKSMGFSLGR